MGCRSRYGDRQRGWIRPIYRLDSNWAALMQTARLPDAIGAFRRADGGEAGFRAGDTTCLAWRWSAGQ